MKYKMVQIHNYTISHLYEYAIIRKCVASSVKRSHVSYIVRSFRCTKAAPHAGSQRLQRTER